ncbi:MAG: SAM-dependent methyltransferase, partial [Pseudomonadales bacterium]|nr:SAM-dependent methyltransferase [Pseudomonadales bacterium]
LVREKIPFQVIPGITAASGCAAYAGIPLTHRDHAQSCVFVTGHLKDGQLDLNWSALCQPGQTVVVYMSLTGLETLCSKMIRHGADGDLPAALIQQGTTRNQKVITGTLATLPGTVSSVDIKPPTLLVIGHVVSLRSGLAWYNPDDCSPDTDTETTLHAKSDFSR